MWGFGCQKLLEPFVAIAMTQIGETTFFLLAPVGGGMTLDHQGGELTVLTPESPMYRRLIRLRTGDSLESPTLLVTEVG